MTDIIFHWNGISDTPSRCRVRIYEHPDRTVVLLTSLEHDNGTLIGCGIELLANQIEEQFDLDPDSTDWLDQIVYKWGEETFSQIDLIRQNGIVIDAEWNVGMSRSEAELMIGQELVDLSPVLVQ